MMHGATTVTGSRGTAPIIRNRKREQAPHGRARGEREDGPRVACFAVYTIRYALHSVNCTLLNRSSRSDGARSPAGGGVFSVKTAPRRPPLARVTPPRLAHGLCSMLTVTPPPAIQHLRADCHTDSTRLACTIYVPHMRALATERRCAPQMAHPRHRCIVHRLFMDQPTCMLKSSFGARAQCMHACAQCMHAFGACAQCRGNESAPPPWLLLLGR